MGLGLMQLPGLVCLMSACGGGTAGAPPAPTATSAAASPSAASTPTETGGTPADSSSGAGEPVAECKPIEFAIPEPDTKVLWISEAIPLAVTALLAPALAVLLSVVPADQA
ncbi:MAG: hypothetical protein KC492_44455, partial [Myxococcales bacterium]|nr:hypothetical protein [Myxococcales bacterium]